MNKQNKHCDMKHPKVTNAPIQLNVMSESFTRPSKPLLYIWYPELAFNVELVAFGNSGKVI